MISIKKNFAYNSFLMVSNYIINFLLFPYCTRTLGVERFGTINFTDNIVQYFLFLSMMGVSHVGVREIAKQKDKKSYSKCFSSIWGLNLIYTIISLTIYIPMIFIVDRFTNIRVLFLLGSFQILFTTFSVDWFFRGIENFKYITIRNLIIKVCYILCVFTFVKQTDDYIFFYFLTVSMTAICAITNYFYAQKFVVFSFRDIEFNRYLKSTLSLGTYNVLTSMYTTFNVAYLGFVWDDIQVGYYSTALKLYTVILGFYSAFTGVMLPRMTNINRERCQETFNIMINKSFELLLTFTIPITIILFVLASEIVVVFAGEDFFPSAILSRIVVPMLLIVGVAQVLAFQILIPKGYDKQPLYAAIIGASIGITLNLILTTKLGALGACITVAITEITVTTYYVFFVIRNKLISFDICLILRHIVIALPYIFLCLSPCVFFNNSAIILIVAILLCASYFVFSQTKILKNEIIISAISGIKSRKKIS